VEAVETIETLYETFKGKGAAMCYHMEALRELAGECSVAVEFGVRGAYSTIALLAGNTTLHSYDVEVLHKHERTHRRIKEAVGHRWEFNLESSLTCDLPTPTDLMLHDSLHNRAQVREELGRHGDKVGRFIVFHDSISHGVVGQRVSCGPGVDGIGGIRIAIDKWMVRNREWRIRSHEVRKAGLLVLERWM